MLRSMKSSMSDNRYRMARVPTRTKGSSGRFRKRAATSIAALMPINVAAVFSQTSSGVMPLWLLTTGFWWVMLNNLRSSQLTVLTQERSFHPQAVENNTLIFRELASATYCYGLYATGCPTLCVTLSGLRRSMTRSIPLAIASNAAFFSLRYSCLSYARSTVPCTTLPEGALGMLLLNASA